MSHKQRHQLSAFLIGSIFMLPILFGRNWVAGNDSPYHLIMARHPVALALADVFPWLHWTLFRDSFVNHHMGFQLLLSPLVFLSDVFTGDLVWGGQAALLICSGMTAMCLYRILRLRGIPAPLVWIALMGVLPWQYWMRQGFVRAPIVALPMMLFAVELLIRRRPVWLAAWACLFMMAYFGAVLFALVAGCMLVGFMIGEGLSRKTLYMALGVGAGLAAGFVVHPSFPENIAFMKVQLFDSGFSAAGDIGGEWKPPPIRPALTMWAPVLCLWGFALIRRLKEGMAADGVTIGLILLAVGFLVLFLLMRRFVEYAPVFFLLSAADLARIDAVFIRTRVHPAGRVVAILGLAILVTSGPLIARGRMRPSFNKQEIVPAMTWLKDNTQKGSMVFTDDWDQFPRCFYFNRHNTYAVGLDPMFTARVFPEHWRRYRQITRGKAPVSANGDDVSMEDIGRLFQADYVLVRRDHKKLYRLLNQAPHLFERVYPQEESDGQPPAAIYRVLAPEPLPGNP